MKCHTDGWNKNACLLILKQNVPASPLHNKKPKPLFAFPSLWVHKLYFMPILSKTLKCNICFLSKCIIMYISVVTEDRLWR